MLVRSCKLLVCVLWFVAAIPACAALAFTAVQPSQRWPAPRLAILKGLVRWSSTNVAGGAFCKEP